VNLASRLLLLGACVASVPSRLPLAAQRLSLAGGASAARVQSLAPTGVMTEYTGTVLGGTGQLAVGPVALELGYWQGSLTPARDVVEARALVGVRVGGWLVLRGGPHVRSYVTRAGTERWVLWQVRVRTEQALVGPGVRVHAEGWRTVAGEVNAPQAFDRAQGGEVGLTLRPARGPFWVRLAYGLDDAKLGGAVRRETVELLSLGVGIGGR